VLWAVRTLSSPIQIAVIVPQVGGDVEIDIEARIGGTQSTPMSGPTISHQERCAAGRAGYWNWITLRRLGIGSGLRLRRMSHISSEDIQVLERELAAHPALSPDAERLDQGLQLADSVRQVIFEDARLVRRGGARHDCLRLPAPSVAATEGGRHARQAAAQIV